MITRVWDCGLVPETADELCEWIAENSWPKVRIVDGFVGGSLYLPMSGSKDRMVTVAHWRDAESLASYAGADWLETPIVYEEEKRFITSWPTLTHLTRVQHITPAGSI